MPIAVPAHPVPGGPLAVRYHAYELTPLRAGTEAILSIDLENAGTAVWPQDGEHFIALSYHWLDRYGTLLVRDGLTTPLPHTLLPGERANAWLRVAAPIPPGHYRLEIDLTDVHSFWFADLGNSTLALDVDVLPRLSRRALEARVGEGPADAVAATQRALQAQEEPLVTEDAEATAYLAAGCLPAPDWSRRVLDAHDEGYAVVGGSVAVVGSLLVRRRVARALEAWRPGFGRAPGWRKPLLCPSLVAGLEGVPWLEPVVGLPALDPTQLEEPWLCDGRIRVAIEARHAAGA